MLSLGQSSTPRVTQAFRPAPEPPQEYFMNVPQPVPLESPQRGPEATFPAPNSDSSHGARRTSSTPPRETARASRPYQAPPDAPLPPHRTPVPPASVCRRSGVPYADDEATWNMDSVRPLVSFTYLRGGLTLLPGSPPAEP
ncbi:hypothetical protein BJV78DRAFT_949500 [Lactifluus subvellereus]|nr:hypothetical protein BJV78DRAFT_949500 [Lactifluus subvellereus]